MPRDAPAADRAHVGTALRRDALRGELPLMSVAAAISFLTVPGNAARESGRAQRRNAQRALDANAGSVSSRAAS